MTDNAESGGARRGNRWRIAAWSAAALVLLLPLFAMQFTDEVAWDAVDFVIFGALLGGAGAAIELAVRRTGNTAYRRAAGIAVAAAVLLIWVNGAVGMIGDEGNHANQMYFGVLAVGIIGAITARFRPVGMARAMFATAAALIVVASIALVGRLGTPSSGPLEIVVLNGFFAALFVFSGRLFLRSTEER